MKAAIPIAQMKWIDRADCRPPEHIDKPGQSRVHAGRHCEAGQDQERDQPEQDKAVSDLLQRIV